jgi:hypothetical protein
MDPLQYNADAGVALKETKGADFPVHAVVVPLSDVRGSELGRPRYPRIAQHIVSNRARTPISDEAPSLCVWRWTVVIQGICRRPSTTAHDRRRDALFSATRFIETAKRIIRFDPTQLGATITHAPCEPATPDDLPGQHVLCLEMRDTDPATIGRIYDRLAAEAWTIGRLSSTTFSFTPHAANPTVLYDLETPAVAAPRTSAPGSNRLPEMMPEAARSSRAG